MALRVLITFFVALALIPVAGALKARLNVAPPDAYDHARATENRVKLESQIDLHRVYTKIAVIGDSYTGGSEMGGTAPGKNWVELASAELLKSGTTIQWVRNGAGGSGYVARGQTDRTFLDLVPLTVEPTTELVVIFGSRNDASDPVVEAAADAVLAKAKSVAPDAKILVIGPPSVSENVPSSYEDIRDQLGRAAERAGATFQDPLREQWFFGPDSDLIGSDGVHPTDGGHAYMAAKIAPRMAELLKS